MNRYSFLNTGDIATCERCLDAAPIRYRVSTDELTMFVCHDCGEYAKELLLPVERVC